MQLMLRAGLQCCGTEGTDLRALARRARGTPCGESLAVPESRKYLLYARIFSSRLSIRVMTAAPIEAQPDEAIWNLRVLTTTELTLHAAVWRQPS